MTLSETVHLQNENKSLLSTVEKLRLKISILEREIQILKEGKDNFNTHVAHDGHIFNTILYIQGVPKKSGISFQRSFLALKWPKIKKNKETDPP